MPSILCKLCNVSKIQLKAYNNRPFPSSPGPLFQNEGRCSAFDMEIIFHSHANKTHFHSAPSLILKVRVFGTRKWPIRDLKIPRYRCTGTGSVPVHVKFSCA